VTDSVLSEGELRFLAAARRATLATTAADGRIRLVPICFAVVAGESALLANPAIWSPLDEKPKAVSDPHRLARVQDLLARPAATLLVDRWDEDWAQLAWLRIEAIGSLVEPAAPGHARAVLALRERYPQYADHRLETRPMLRFEPVRAVSWGALG
jgi:PPOX class probable F420-dependent enzyme